MSGALSSNSAFGATCSTSVYTANTYLRSTIGTTRPAGAVDHVRFLFGIVVFRSFGFKHGNE